MDGRDRIASADDGPPMMDVAPAAVAAATALATSKVPFAKAGSSKTPMGPFHTIVFALAISATYIAIVLGPMSRPIWSGGVADTSQTVALAAGFNSGATRWSVGSKSLKFFCWASASKRLASSILSFSTSDLPMGSPFAFSKVYAMPPPISMVSAIFIRFSTTSILSLTLAPPRIAAKGRAGLVTAFPR